MASQSRKQSLQALAVVFAVVVTLLAARTLYQGQRRRGDVEAAREVVRQQLDAIQAGDYEKAFTFSASGFHERMTVAEFRRMVEDGYPDIAKAREVRLGRADRRGSRLAVEVTVTVGDGRTADHLYLLVRENGTWKVAGVRAGSLPGTTPPSSA
jgi:hypothetical protein